MGGYYLLCIVSTVDVISLRFCDDERVWTYVDLGANATRTPTG